MEPTASGRFKISSQSSSSSGSQLHQSTRNRTLCDEILTAEGGLSGFDLFPVPDTEARHLNLSSNNSPTTLTLSTLSTPSLLTPLPYLPTVTLSTVTQSIVLVPIPVIPAPVINAAMANIPMPSKGNHSTLKFDPKQPHELHRYFDNLDFTFGHTAVTTENAKKQHACQYVDVDTSKLWETLKEYTDATKCTTNLKPLSTCCTLDQKKKGSVL